MNLKCIADQTMHEKVYALLTLAVTLLLIAFSLELGLRFLPVSSGLFAQPVNVNNPVFRFQANRPYTYSRGWKFTAENNGRVNNSGFVNDQEYDPTAGTPVFAVIGDSYVEALMVPYAQTLHGRLAENLADKARVYSFAASGAPLSQYLVWTKYARDEFNASRFIFVVVGNDFDESLLSYKAGPGFHHFNYEGPALRLIRVDYRPGRFRGVVRESALARYLVFNLEILQAPAKVKRLWNNKGRLPDRREQQIFVGQTKTEVSPQRLRDSQAAADAFLMELQHMGLGKDQVLIVLDGLRPHLYDQAALAYAETTYFGLMRSYLRTQAQRFGYALVDMQASFIEQHRHSGERFESVWDAHWNSSAHALAAAEIMNTDFFDMENSK